MMDRFVMAKKIRRALSSVKVRLAIIGVCIGLIGLEALVYLGNEFTLRHFEDRYQEKALLMQRSILHHLQEGISGGSHRQALLSLKGHLREAGALEIRLFDSRGREAFAGAEPAAERRVEEALRAGKRIHFSRGAGEEEAMTFIFPVPRGQPECAGCHAPAEGPVAAVLLSLSLAEMRQIVAAEKRKYSLLFALVALASGAGITAAVSGLFLRPLARIQKGTEAMEQGRLDYRIPAPSQDEIGTLARHFNRMAQTLQSSFLEMEEKNRQLAEYVARQKENEARLAMSARLSALGQMASSIAHEINTPLATVAACAEGLVKRIKKQQWDPAFFERYLAIIVEEVQRCTRMTRDLLFFVRKPAEEKQSVDLQALLEKALKIFGSLGRLKRVEVVRRYAPGVPAVLGSEGRLQQVFLAIIGNALEAMEDMGTLVLETGVEGEAVFVRIQDTGPGIPAGLGEKIFEPFFTTKSARGGTGLGLATAYQIVKEHQGTICVAPPEGRGACFSVLLPR